MSQIGLGWKLAVNDGVADAFADVDALTELSVPDDGPVGMAESKRLDITGNTVTRVPTVQTPGAFTFTYEHTKARYDRFKVLKRVEKNWKVTSTEATPFVRTVPGVLSQQEISGVQADGIVLCTVTVEVTGPAT